MGARPSRFGPEAALQCVNQDQLRELQEACNKLAHDGIVDRSRCFNSVFDPLFPPVVADLFYRIIGGLQRGIPANDLACGLAILNGTNNTLRVQMIFAALDLDGRETLTRRDVDQLRMPGESDTAIINFFATHGVMSFGAFSHFINDPANGLSITAWLGGPGIRGCPRLRVPSQLQTLARESGFTEDEVAAIDDQFTSLRNSATCHRLTLPHVVESLRACPSSLALATGLTLYLDRNGDGTLDRRELLMQLARLARGPDTTRMAVRMLAWLLRSRAESSTDEDTPTRPGEAAFAFDAGMLASFLAVVRSVEQHPPRDKAESAPPAEEDPDEEDFFVSKCACESTKLDFKSLVTPLITPACRADADSILASHGSGGLLSEDQALAWARDTGALQPYLAALKHLFIMVLGVLPQTPREEIDAVLFQHDYDVSMGSLSQSGNPCYLIARTWWDAWRSERPAARQPDAKRVGPIANATLQDKPLISTDRIVGALGLGAPSPLKLKRGLLEGTHFVTVSEVVWDALRAWHGGGPVLRRYTALIDGKVQVELFPLSLRILRHVASRNQQSDKSDKPPVQYLTTITISKFVSTQELLSSARGYLGNTRREKHCRLWNYSDPTQPRPIPIDRDTLVRMIDPPLEDGTSLLLEVRNADLSWPSEVYAVQRAKGNTSAGAVVTTLPTTRGQTLTGLSNMGNTCYLNSALQLLRACGPLTTYFRNFLHIDEINETNVLGLKGAMARAYAATITQLLSGRASIAPLDLLALLQKQHAFTPHNQHDAQEALAYILDILHEDLNRVRSKPYVERKDSNGRPDAVVAEEAWQGHLLRNQSVLVDLFHGLLRSGLRCAGCGFTSVAFDPFTMLTLPLPAEDTSTMEVILHWLRPRPATRFTLALPSGLVTYGTLRDALSTVAKICPCTIVFADISSNYTARRYNMHERVKSTHMVFITAWETLPACHPFTTDAPAPEPAKPATPPAPSAAAAPAGPAAATGASGVPTPPRTCCACIQPGVTVVDPTSVPSSAPHASASSSSHTLAQSHAPALPSAAAPDTATTVPPDCTTVLAPDTVMPPGPAAASEESPPPTGAAAAASSSNHGAPPALPPYTGRAVGPLVPDHIVVVHRKFVFRDIEIPFVPATPTLFGQPLLLPLRAGVTTGRMLYAWVWALVRPTLPAEWPTTGDYPFTLSLVDSVRLHCPQCPWHKFCAGCLLPCDDNLVDASAVASASSLGASAMPAPVSSQGVGPANKSRPGTVSSTTQDDRLGHVGHHSHESRRSVSLAIDWNIRLLHLHGRPQSDALDEHESVAANKARLQRPIELSECFNAFTKEERLTDADQWNCPKCKGRQQATKSLDVWAYPPGLLVHLKRFYNNNSTWQKSSARVIAPPTLELTGLYTRDQAAAPAAPAPDAADAPTVVPAPAPTAASEAPRTAAEIPVPGEAGEHPATDTAALADALAETDAEPATSAAAAAVAAPAASTAPAPAAAAALTPVAAAAAAPRPRPVVDVAHTQAYANGQPSHHYDLAAIVCHSGHLGGGHYVAYVREGTQWFSCNDSTCRPVPYERVPVETAYLLYYQARDIDTSALLPAASPRAQDQAAEAREPSRDSVCTIC